MFYAYIRNNSQAEAIFPEWKNERSNPIRPPDMYVYREWERNKYRPNKVEQKDTWYSRVFTD